MIFQLFSFCMDIHFCIANQAVGGSRLNVARRHVVTFRGWLFLSRYASALSRARRSMRGVWRADGCVVGLLLPPWAASLDWSGDTCTWWSCRASIRRLARTHALLPQRRRRRHLGQAFLESCSPAVALIAVRRSCDMRHQTTYVECWRKMWLKRCCGQQFYPHLLHHDLDQKKVGNHRRRWRGIGAFKSRRFHFSLVFSFKRDIIL